MKQYNIYKSKNRRSPVKLLCVIQSDYMNDLSTIIAAPVYLVKGSNPISVLHPLISINEESYFVEVESLSALDRRYFGDHVADVSEDYYEFSKALDRLFSGI